MGYLKDRAKTPEEKRAVIERIYEAWLKLPEQRLGQLIINATGDADNFYDNSKIDFEEI